MNDAKETQRAELHKTIWRIANDLRGSVDGWDFKTYVLGMLFYRFISENLAGYLNEQERKAGHKNFDYAGLSDKDAKRGRETTIGEKGFYILPSQLFANVRGRARQDANLNETLAKVFKAIEGSAQGTDSEDDLKGLFDDLDVNSNKLGQTVAKRNEKLVKLLDTIGDLPLGSVAGASIDLFGDAYEYLMQMYASTAGKSGGEFYTPQEVSELLARITVAGKTSVNKVYDPACGSGSLLLKFSKVLGPGKVRQGFFGQEVNLTTFNLCRINMFLHDIGYEKFDIAHGDTLTDPAQKSKRDNKTLFIDASAEFVRNGNKNKLTEQNRDKIYDAFISRKNAAHFAKLVDNKALSENGYNISVSSYVEQKDTRVAVDIKALNADIARIVKRQAELRTAIDAIVTDLEGAG